jgi:uncharacterized protein YoxC
VGVISAFASDYGLALAAIVVSILTLLVTVVMSARSVSASRVEEMEKDLEACRKDRERLTGEVARLRDVEIDLMRRIYRLENGRMT